MIRLTAPHRDSDSFGAGHFGAPRGSRTHKGVDFLAAKRSKVHAITSGTVTKLGIVYSDTLNYTYVQITDSIGNDWRYFYVKTSVLLGNVIQSDDIIGIVQDLDMRYKGIPNHIHLEIKDSVGEYINPESLLSKL